MSKRIGLIDVDSYHYPNLALMKISSYHKAKGDQVEWCSGLQYYDVIYKSRVFDDTYTQEIPWELNCDKLVQGGTGYDVDNKLSDEMEYSYPDYGLYGISDTAYGFLTRGCPRRCPFCIVSRKEGVESKKVASLSMFHQEQRYIKLMDANILACSDHEELLQQLIASKAFVDFNQGLDVRLLTKDNIALLNKCRIKLLHFAWDNPKEDLSPHFERLNRYGRIKDPAKRIVYVLTNYNTSHKEDLNRVSTLLDLGYHPYIMIYDKLTAPEITKRLQRWVNNRRIFGSTKEFKAFTNRRPLEGQTVLSI